MQYNYIHRYNVIIRDDRNKLNAIFNCELHDHNTIHCTNVVRQVYAVLQKSIEKTLAKYKSLNNNIGRPRPVG